MAVQQQQTALLSHCPIGRQEDRQVLLSREATPTLTQLLLCQYPRHNRALILSTTCIPKLIVKAPFAFGAKPRSPCKHLNGLERLNT